MGAIDILCNDFSVEGIARNFLNTDEAELFAGKGRSDNLVGLSVPDMVSRMNENGVDKVLVTAIKVWDFFHQRMHSENSPEDIHALCKEAPDRVHGLYGINPFTRMEGVRELEKVVKEFGFVGAHIHPHGFDLRPDDAFYFPFYAKCEELDVPVVLSMGHTMDFLPNENGRPLHLDKVALYFKNLKIISTHTGWPWVEENIALASKHPNVFIGTSAYAPKYWKPELVKFLNSWGRNKVMWGTDYPLIMHDESLAQIDELGLREESKKALLEGNARSVFGL